MNSLMIVLGVVITIAAVVFLIINKVRTDDGYEPPLKNFKVLLISALVFGLVLFVGGNSFKIVPTNQIGVKSMYGQIYEQPAKQGLNFKVPFAQKIELVNCKQQDIEFEEQIWGETSERTPVYMANTTVTYQIDPDSAVWIHKNVSNYNSNLISADIVASALKSASKNFPAQDVTTRDKIQPLAKEKLQQMLDDKYGENVVHIISVIIDDMDFKEEYNQAIAKKSNAQMAYEQAQIANKTALEAAENQNAIDIKNAEAAAQAKKIEAQGEADAIKIKADAEAEANKKLAQSLNDDVLTHEYYEKWNGTLPEVMDPNASIILNNSSEK